MRFHFAPQWLFILLCSLVLTACGSSDSPKSKSETANTINIMGVDGPLAGADIAVYDLQDYLDADLEIEKPDTLLAAPATTDPVTALADNLALVSDAGTGPFLIVVTANSTTTDLTTGEAPVVSEVKTIKTLLDLDESLRTYASPLTSLAVDIAMDDPNFADNFSAGLEAAQQKAKALFGFGMNPEIDIFTVPPILDETTTDPVVQQQVAEYRAATEIFAAVVEQLVSDEVFASNEKALEIIVDDALDGVIDGTQIVEEVNKVNENYLSDTDRLPVGTTIQDLLNNNDSGLSDNYAVDDSVVVVISSPDSDNDGVFNDVDAFDSDPLLVADPDGDSVDSSGLLEVTQDNCPTVSNQDQLDTDTDGAGNACDAFPNDADNDIDGDNVSGDIDNCPSVDNTTQTNSDTDAQGDACDTDDDNDSVLDTDDAFPINPLLAADPDEDGVDSGNASGQPQDNCPSVSNATQTNLDTDAQGDACDADDDNDSVLDTDDAFPINPLLAADPDGDGIDSGNASGQPQDNCPSVSNATQTNLDTDAQGDACDADDDNDSVLDTDDAFPTNPLLAADPDEDGVDSGNASGQLQDNCPTNANADQLDTDTDGAGDVCDAFPNDADNDIDSDGIGGDVDNCPSVDNTTQTNSDTDAQGDACDADDDNDSVLDTDDAFPINPLLAADPDEDGVDSGNASGQLQDNCPTNANADQLDTDTDGAGDVCDAFPNDADNDIDSDGIGGDIDNCPSVDNTTQTNSDTDAQGDACDADDDNDSVLDTDDAFPINPLLAADPDEDGVDSGNASGQPQDNCPSVSNATQTNLDTDAQGDACDADDDNDSVLDTDDAFPINPLLAADPDEDGVDSGNASGQLQDNCPTNANADQLDTDTDGAGDVCDAFPNDADNDIDSDGIGGDIDNCPSVSNATQTNSDTDAQGDACDTDDDNDSVLDTDDAFPINPLLAADPDGDSVDSSGLLEVTQDNCPLVSNATQTNSDTDAQGDACDTDDDNDGVSDDVDAFDTDPTLAADPDEDGVDSGNASGQLQDNCPTNANADQLDTDTDGAGDVCDAFPNDADNDIDSDGIGGDVDNCPSVSNATQTNSDTDAQGDACDTDDDNDSVLDTDDAFPINPLLAADPDGDSVDSSGLLEVTQDNCPLVSNATQTNSDTDAQGDACDTDDDNDGVSDDVDAFDTDPTLAADPDEDGVDSGNASGQLQDNCPTNVNADQLDTDTDGAGDVCDAFPNDADNDIDSDGIGGDVDNCPSIANPDQENADADARGDACEGDTISVFGIDGPMAGADVFIYHLQEFIEASPGSENLLADPVTTDPVTGLADNIELVLDAGEGPFAVGIIANETTIDLSTGESPVIGVLFTVVTSLTDDRFYATPLTTAATLFAMEAGGLTDGLGGSMSNDDFIAGLAEGQQLAKAYLGFGMDADIDIFTTPPVLDETTTTLELQQQVAQYRGASEALSAVLEGLGGSEPGGPFEDDPFQFFFDLLENEVLDNTVLINAIQAFSFTDITSRLADPSITSIAGLLNADATTLADYTVDAGVNAAPSNVVDADADGVYNFEDAFPFDPSETVDSDSDTVGDNADAFPNDPNETLDSDNDTVGDNADVFPNDPNETLDSDNDTVGDNADVFPNDPNETLDSDNDTVGDNADAFPNDPNETLDSDNDTVGDNADAFPNDPNETLDSDNDTVGDNADVFPNDPNETLDSDNDTVGDNADNCPSIANPDQLDTDSDGTGDVCDSTPTGDTDSDTVDNAVDNCPADANTNQVDTDSDGEGDACDAFPNDADNDIDGDGVSGDIDNCPAVSNPDQADDDNNNVGDVCETTSVSVKYHFDFFYNQLSSDTGAFKAAVVGETVTQANGFIDIGTGVDSTTLDLGSSGTGTFNVRADYAITEESLSYTGTDFSLATATFTDETLSDDDLANTVTLLNDVLSFTDEVVTTDLTAWGANTNNYIGSGRVTLNGASTTLTTAEEQALSILSLADGNSDDADLNADYGVVILDIVYGNYGQSATIDELVNLFSVVGVFGLDGAGNVALSEGSGFVSGLGIADGFVGFSAELPATSGTYTVSPTGAVDLVIDGESSYGFADSAGDLFTLGDPASRTYGVKLGAGKTSANLAAKSFELKGLVIESSNKRLGASTYEGLTATFNANGTALTLAGTIDQALAPFSDVSLPLVTATSAEFSFTSETITIADNGRFDPIIFANSGLELEGFIAANGGLLLRVVEMETIVIAGTSAGLQVGADFYPVTGPVFNNITPQDIEAGDFRTVLTSDGQFLAGIWVAASGSETTSAITSDVRSGSGPDFGSIAEGTTVTISQGVLFGFPPSFTVILDGDTDGIDDDVDNCPSIANTDQLDTDTDGLGNVCDLTPNGDDDSDTIDNLADNCPAVVNTGQIDTDTDGLGDACDLTPNGDDDSDTIDNLADNCPALANVDQQDTDNDGTGDVCDETPNGDTDPNDLDGDGTVNDEDPSPEGGFACRLFGDGRFICG